MNNLRQTFEQMSVPTCVIDSEQHIVFWNPAAAATFGHCVQDVMGAPCWRVFQGKTPEGESICRPNCPLISKGSKNRPVVNFDMVTKGSDGLSHQVRVHSLPLLTQERQGIQLVHFLRPSRHTDPTYNLYLLGPARIQTAEGNLIEAENWADLEQQALFIYLVLNRDHLVTVSELAQQFWPQLTGEKGQQQVTAVLEKLCDSLKPTKAHTRHLVEPLILKVGDGYKLQDAISVWVDIDEFDKLLARTASECNPTRKILLLLQAVSLYRDDFLINLPFSQEWIISWRTYFRQGYLAALHMLQVLYSRAGDLESAQKYGPGGELFSEENFNLSPHFFAANTSSSQTLRQCKRLISLLQNELEILLEETYHQPLDDLDAADELPQGEGRR